MNQTELKRILDAHPELRQKLYARGFLLSDDQIEADKYPFYGLWKETLFGRYHLLTSEGTNCFVFSTEITSMALVGHAYDPFTMVFQETEILCDLTKALSTGEDCFWDQLNNLTGVFTLLVLKDGELRVIGDAAGLQSTFYCVKNGRVYIASHTNIFSDLLSLCRDPYIERLAHYRFFKLLGNSLPGDLTPFSEVKRLVPNHYVLIDKKKEIAVKRFYWPHLLKMSRSEIVEEVSQIMHANMFLISQKWDRPAISMTGGCDSKTTLACTNGLYEKFSYFSYISSESEEVDAYAAKSICEALGLKHTIYQIPDDDNALPDVACVREIINWNTGDIRYSNPNDVRKRICFSEVDDFDVEVKSWASEIGRAYYSKRFNGRKDFGEHPTPRKCTSLYKFFLFDRKLVKDTDRVFAEYLNHYFEQSDDSPIEWQEQFFWEFRVPSWNGIVITGEHRYSFDITIPYNNRRILQLLLSAPIEDRINDRVYFEIREKQNPSIDKTGISVTNIKHTKNRDKMENIYFSLHSSLPF